MSTQRLTAEHLLVAWERGDVVSPADQAAVILDSVGCDTPCEPLTIGQCNALLLRLRGDSFGPTMRMRTDCPSCGRAVDAHVDVAEVAASGDVPADDAATTRSLDHDDWTLTYRLPTMRDFAAIAGAGDVATARAMLIAACVSKVRQGGRSASAGDLPAAVLDALADAMEAWDPLIETAMAMECTGCGHDWHAVLEVGSFLHAEIGDAAVRIVRDVDELARRYGWRETDILAMSTARRALYLEQAAQGG